MTSEQQFHARVNGQSDISQHLCTLRLLARTCSHITEFGVRTGNSTVAFLAGLPPGGILCSYDLNPPQFPLPDDASHRWNFTRANTAQLENILPTDLLFIDTLHTHDQVVAELKHGNQARKWLVFHDTVLFGTHGENGQPGITRAIDDFCARNPHWRTFAACTHNNGLLVLERQ